MDDQQKAALESQSLELRAELKSWESAWAKSHDGRKPGRGDIKDNPDIGIPPARKYKQYNKLRDILSGKVAPPPKPHVEPKKRRSPAEFKTQTPSKRQKHFETPSKTRPSPHNPTSAATPSISRTLFSPAPPRSIGPTPQRDGRVLGLFDLMVERELGTPSRGAGVTAVCEAPSSQTTPSKRKAAEMEDDNDAKPGRTPMSTSKRQLLDSFMTPLKSKDANAQAARTPMSVSKLQFSTPAFLKRHSRAPLDDENGPVPSPPPLRLPRKPHGRGLSAIVASLRKIEEEETHEEDMEALREMEMESGEAPPPDGPGKPQQAGSMREKEEADILAADSQVRNLPLGGFDDEAMYDSPVEEEQLDRNGQPLRVYKKKGQKRTTRRSNMKPVFIKRRTAVPVGEGGPVAGDDDGVPSDLDDFVPSDVDGEGGEEGKTTSEKKAAKEGPVKKAVRKVNQLAHANFRRLKLKNYGAKGGPGHNSRFRRRR
ncbi:hypothetical protein ACRALDRAFT_1083682 [Sodiomyces alcalophilus JCM 7366]|uniref:uncharacterized protein n=1 Tax=Sodiomyces alcalophilus JCM 7366 TaxID=591952 RepID=UPI0039B45AF0